MASATSSNSGVHSESASSRSQPPIKEDQVFFRTSLSPLILAWIEFGKNLSLTCVLYFSGCVKRECDRGELEERDRRRPTWVSSQLIYIYTHMISFFSIFLRKFKLKCDCAIWKGFDNRSHVIMILGLLVDFRFVVSSYLVFLWFYVSFMNY